MPIQFPVVSVVTPSHNSSRFIRETIESVLSQKYPAIEHIVIDGCSTDGTLDILREYPHLTWISEPDRGQSEALNKGFRQAQGEIVGWLNADDTYQSGAVATAVNFLLDHPEVDLVYSDVQIIDERSRPVGIARGEPFSLPILLRKSIVKQPTVFMRRKVIDVLGGVDESLHYVMDREMWLRAGTVFCLVYMPEHILASFRLCPGTKSFEARPKFRIEWLKVLGNISKDPVFNKIPERIKHKALKKTRAAYYLSLMVQAIELRDRKMMFQYFIQVLVQDWKMVFNRGTWFFIGKGLLGKPIDRLERFK